MGLRACSQYCDTARPSHPHFFFAPRPARLRAALFVNPGMLWACVSHLRLASWVLAAESLRDLPGGALEGPGDIVSCVRRFSPMGGSLLEARWSPLPQAARR